MPTPKQYSNSAARQQAYRERVKQSRAQERVDKGMPFGSAIGTMPSRHRWVGLLGLAQSSLQCALDEMESYYDDRSELWQENERGEALKDRIESLQSLIDEISNLRQDN